MSINNNKIGLEYPVITNCSLPGGFMAIGQLIHVWVQVVHKPPENIH